LDRALGVLDFDYLLVGDRRRSGPLVEVRDDSGQHLKYTGTVERQVFGLGIGVGPQIDYDHLPAVQSFQPIAAPAKSFHLPRKASRKVGMDLGENRSRK
jgi:hypothetical protein